MIQKFRKKPVVIDAVQYPGYMTDEIKTFCGDSLISEARDGIGVMGYFLKTLEGHSYMLSKNDWIIKGVHGELYPCKPDIFEKTYELASNQKSEQDREARYTKEHLKIVWDAATAKEAAWVDTDTQNGLPDFDATVNSLTIPPVPSTSTADNESADRSLKQQGSTEQGECRHDYVQKDANWKACRHCGTIAPTLT